MGACEKASENNGREMWLQCCTANAAIIWRASTFNYALHAPTSDIFTVVVVGGVVQQ